MTNKQRIDWPDIAKAIGIILVVASHSGNQEAGYYLFWFHMPLFFLLSGYFFKPINSYQKLITSVKNRSKQLIIPYISFFVLILIIKSTYIFFTGDLTLKSILNDVLRFIYGGQLLTGFYGTFWFITCLLTTHIIFSFITFKVKSIPIQILIIVIFYFIANLESWINNNNYFSIPIPWNIDVSLFAISYFALGYYARFFVQKLNHFIVCFIATVSGAIFVLLDLYTEFDFILDLKNIQYGTFAINLIIPIVFSLIVFYLSYALSKIHFIKNIKYIGVSSLTIMYLHFSIKYLTQDYSFYNVYTFTIVGTVIPFLFNHFIISKFETTQKLFLGITKK